MYCTCSTNACISFHRYSYMIDNIILLITGTLHQRPIGELIPKCHPLGSFEEMASINIASTPAELYNALMIDTPLAPFFVECISEQDLDEMNIEIIRNTLYKVMFSIDYVLGTSCSDQRQPLDYRSHPPALADSPPAPIDSPPAPIDSPLRPCR